MHVQFPLNSIKGTRPLKAANRPMAQVLHFGAKAVRSETPKNAPWKTLAVLAGSMLGLLPGIPSPVKAQDTPPTVQQPSEKIDFTNAAQLRALAHDTNTDKALKVAQNLGKVKHPGLRLELTQTLLQYQLPQALAMHHQLGSLNEVVNAKDAFWEDCKEALENLENKDFQPENPEVKALMSNPEKLKTTIDRLETQIGKLSEDITKLDLHLAEINAVTVQAIKHGLTTFKDLPDIQEASFKKLINDPRGKVRLVAANYLHVLANDTAKAQLALTVADYNLNQRFYPPGHYNDVPLNTIGTAAVHAAATIQDETLRIKTLTTLSQQPLSSVKNAITGELAKVSADYEKYHDMVIGASGSTIPGQFMMLEEILSKWPPATLKTLSTDLLKQQTTPPSDALREAYSRTMGVALIKYLPETENAYKMTVLKQAVKDLNSDPVMGAALTGYPFEDNTPLKQELNQYYLGLDDKAGPHTFIARAFAVSSAHQCGYENDVLAKAYEKSAADPNATVRIYTAAALKHCANPELRTTLLTRLTQDAEEAVRQVAEATLKDLQSPTPQP